MVQDSHTQLVDLIARLKRAEIDWDAENIADLVWLSRFIEMSDVEQSETVPSKSVSPKIRTEDIASQPSESDIPLYIPPSPQQQSSVPEVSKSGIPFQTPIAPALRKTLAIGRALRPLMRKVESYTQTVLDEDATAERTAEQQFCMTIIRPAQERWLELTLVVEESASSFLWQETIRDFKQLLERQGAFRSVSVWYLRTDAEGELNLFAKRPTGPLKPLPRSPRELIDASGRRLILLVSDCISPAWRTGNLHKYCLDLWAKKGLLAIVQLLPGHMWHRTALNTGLNVHLGALKPGVPNQQLLIQETPIGLGNKAESGLKLPIVTLAPSSLGQWTRMVAGFGESWTTGIWFDEGWQDWPQVAVTPAESLMPEQLVKRFMTTASGLAKRLAGLMALVPVSLPIIYLIQETMLTESTPLQVAEVFMSGLVQRIEDESAEEEFQNSTEQNYEFVPGVRNVLIESVDTPTAEAVLDRVSQYIGEKVGRSIYSFTALLMLEEEFIGIAGAEFLQFASIAKQVLQHLGGDYAVLLNDMTQVTISNSSEILFSQSLADFPPLKILEFTTAYFGGLPKPETSIPSKTKNKSFSENIGFHTKLKELSPRRREVLDCWLAGQSDRQIAAGLVITEGTVRKHFESLYKLFLGPRSYPDNRSRRDELEALFRQHRSDMVAPFDFHTRLKELSPRLREVLESWLAGQNDRQIAAELVITEGTVRKH
ncbi:MAG: SAV_2336 N-terminal domain-related protein, partial [Cyanobacteria bacterium J06635_1]